MFDFNQTFDIIFINQKLVDKYFENLKLIQDGISFKLSRDNGTFDSQLKNWIKVNVGLNDRYFFGELINFKYQIEAYSVLRIEIKVGNSDLYSEAQEFDMHTSYIQNYNWSSINTEREVSILIKLEDLSIHQENFNYLLKNRNSNLTEDYQKKLFAEILREVSSSKKFSSLGVPKFDLVLNLKDLKEISTDPLQKQYISKFLETLDVSHLFFLLKDNFWKNSNF